MRPVAEVPQAHLGAYQIPYVMGEPNPKLPPLEEESQMGGLDTNAMPKTKACQLKLAGEQLTNLSLTCEG